MCMHVDMGSCIAPANGAITGYYSAITKAFIASIDHFSH